LGFSEEFLFVTIVLFSLGMIGWLYRTLKRTMNDKQALLQEFTDEMKKKAQESQHTPNRD
jgi:cbb3-type cytochrome oxidase subunit 3